MSQGLIEISGRGGRLQLREPGAKEQFLSSQTHLVPISKRLLFNALAIDKGAMGAVQINELKFSILPDNPGMVSGNIEIIQDKVRVGASAHYGLIGIDWVDLLFVLLRTQQFEIGDRHFSCSKRIALIVSDALSKGNTG
jgi:hypothetical protein